MTNPKADAITFLSIDKLQKPFYCVVDWELVDRQKWRDSFPRNRGKLATKIPDLGRVLRINATDPWKGLKSNVHITLEVAELRTVFAGLPLAGTRMWKRWHGNYSFNYCKMYDLNKLSRALSSYHTHWKPQVTLITQDPWEIVSKLAEMGISSEANKFVDALMQGG